MFSGALTLQQQVHALYSDHHGWLHGWLRKKLGCTHRAADLAHDTFVRILARRDAETVAGIREPRAYLTTIAQGLVSNHHRRQTLELAWAESLAALPEAVTPSLEEQAIVLETLIEIDRLLHTLPSPVRQAFLLSRLDGMAHAEIASRMAVSVPTVKRHLAQALVVCCFADEG